MPKSTNHLGEVVAASSLLALPLSLFLYFAWRADTAMDKSGVGDLSDWQSYQGKAGLAFWSAVSVWVMLLVVAGFKPTFRSTASSVCAIVPLIGVVAWFGLLIA